MTDDKNKNPSTEDASTLENSIPNTERSNTEPLTTNFEEEAAKFKDHWIRAVAEAENIRKRATKEREDALKYGVTKFAQDMLSIADNMKRALESCPQTLPKEFHGVIEGVKLINDELKTIFDRHGIQEINPLGDIFDPNLHQAMFEIPATENIAPGRVAQVLQIGYMIHDRLLRPALVGIAKGDAQTENEEISPAKTQSVDIEA